MLFLKNMINYVDENINDWKQGVAIGSQLLIENGYVTNSYIDEVIDITNTHGPYYVIAPQIALLHVLPKENIKENAISFTYFKNPIVFKEEERYRVHYCLALIAKDNSSHMDLLSQVATTFSDKTLLQKLSECQSKKELFKVLKKYRQGQV